MSIVFVGGSRAVSRLPQRFSDRLDAITNDGHPVVVGADRAVQKHFAEAGYDDVMVYCTGNTPRNNLGHWKVCAIVPDSAGKGFQFYAAKDRAMALAADVGLMVWDGSSPGTILNVLRLLHAGKTSTLFDTSADRVTTIRTVGDWDTFLRSCDAGLRHALAERTRPEDLRREPPAPRQTVPEAITAQRLPAVVPTRPAARRIRRTSISTSTAWCPAPRRWRGPSWGWAPVRPRPGRASG